MGGGVLCIWRDERDGIEGTGKGVESEECVDQSQSICIIRDNPFLFC